MKALTEPHLRIRLCEANPGHIYVFGGNLVGRGKAGQAVIRNCANAYEIPTKREPSMAETAFFSDQLEEISIVVARFEGLKKLMAAGYTIVFPLYGLGTGMAKLQEKSPIIFNLINHIVKEEFGVEFQEAK